MNFRSYESFVDPLTKEKQTWNAVGWCLRAAHQPLLCSCPIDPVTPHLVLSWCWCQHLHSKANALRQIWGRFGLKSNPAKYVCLLVCVCDCLKGSISPCDSWKGCTKVCAGRRAGRSKGKMERAQELGRKISLPAIAAKCCIFWSHCLRPEQLHWCL